MRLLTYNIHKGVGSDRRYRLERIVAVIRSRIPTLCAYKKWIATSAARATTISLPCSLISSALRATFTS